MKHARDQQNIVSQIQWKLNEKERYERNQAQAQQKLNQNASDSSAARDLQRATEQLERADQEIDRLKDQL